MTHSAHFCAAKAVQVRIGDYPQLRSLCWSLPAGTVLAGDDVLEIYERGWRVLRHAKMTKPEVDLIRDLASEYGSSLLLDDQGSVDGVAFETLVRPPDLPRFS